MKITRTKIEANIESRLANVITHLAKESERTLGEFLEETLMHSFEAVPGQEGEAVASPHTKKTLKRISELMKENGIDYDTHPTYEFTE